MRPSIQLTQNVFISSGCRMLLCEYSATRLLPAQRTRPSSAQWRHSLSSVVTLTCMHEFNSICIHLKTCSMVLILERKQRKSSQQSTHNDMVMVHWWRHANLDKAGLWCFRLHRARICMTSTVLGSISTAKSMLRRRTPAARRRHYTSNTSAAFSTCAPDEVHYKFRDDIAWMHVELYMRVTCHNRSGLNKTA